MISTITISTDHSTITQHDIASVYELQTILDDFEENLPEEYQINSVMSDCSYFNSIYMYAVSHIISLTDLSDLITLYEEHLAADTIEELTLYIDNTSYHPRIEQEFTEAYEGNYPNKTSFAQDYLTDLYSDILNTPFVTGTIGNFIDWGYVVPELFIQAYDAYTLSDGTVAIFRNI